MDSAFGCICGSQEIRDSVAKAELNRNNGRRTLLFIDEIHRFSKSQQDALLPYTESGLLIFIGATTENPSFEVNRSLLSRAQVYALKPLKIKSFINFYHVRKKHSLAIYIRI